MYRNPVTSQYILDFKKCPIEGVLTVTRGPFLFLLRHSPLVERHLSALKHISDEEYDLVEEYRSDDERHVALQPPTDRSRNMPPRQKCAAASTTKCLRLRRVGKQIFHSTPSNESLPVNITATCSKQEILRPHSIPYQISVVSSFYKPSNPGRELIADAPESLGSIPITT
ncbi:hypothetical protein TNCV_1266451 [Trichonephila clavipes]|nr:hypothetical protein TNCV_1266451 [Trichonephila clavipes]